MKKEDIVIGTTYRIREWEDMVQELGFEHGEIRVGSESFQTEMIPFCGQEFTPTGFEAGTGYLLPTVPLLGYDWCIAPWAIERIYAE